MGGIAVTPSERGITEPLGQKNKGVMTTDAVSGADSRVYTNTDEVVVVEVELLPILLPARSVVGGLTKPILGERKIRV